MKFAKPHFTSSDNQDAIKQKTELTSDFGEFSPEEADIIIEKILIDRLSISGLTLLSEESGIIKSQDDSNLKFIITKLN